jgi:hypothetical protein
VPDYGQAPTPARSCPSELEWRLTRIEIPNGLTEKIGPEMKMDCHWVDVRLKNGKVITNLVVRGGRFITGHADALNGESVLPFSATDIRSIRRRALLGALWPFW